MTVIMGINMLEILEGERRYMYFEESKSDYKF